MTQDSVNAYNAKLTAARNKVQQINQVLAGSPTVDQLIQIRLQQIKRNLIWIMHVKL